MPARTRNKAQVNRVYLEFEGVAMFLGGATQALVFTLVEEMPGITVQKLHKHINTHFGDYAYTTLMTICVRLTEKGLLKRINIGGNKRQYAYTAVITSEDFAQQCVLNTIKRLCEQYPVETSVACEMVNPAKVTTQ